MNAYRNFKEKIPEACLWLSEKAIPNHLKGLGVVSRFEYTMKWEKP